MFVIYFWYSHQDTSQDESLNDINDTTLVQLYIVTISKILQLMTENSPDELNYESLTVFDLSDIPPISIVDYLNRIMTYSEASSRCMIMALSYIDKLNDDAQWPIKLSKFNVHRLVGIAIMVANKFYDESYLPNDQYGMVLGMELKEVNKLERKFLTYISFDINTKFSVFISYVQQILSYAVQNKVIEQRVGKALLDKIYAAGTMESQDGDTSDSHTSSNMC